MPQETNMNKMINYDAHYISETHWDREWHRPFAEYRLLLVPLIDSLLDLMEKGRAFRYFQFDGQTCMLEDYLEIRPQKACLDARGRRGVRWAYRHARQRRSYGVGSCHPHAAPPVRRRHLAWLT